jgi:hypothetical protein
MGVRRIPGFGAEECMAAIDSPRGFTVEMDDASLTVPVAAAALLQTTTGSALSPGAQIFRELDAAVSGEYIVLRCAWCRAVCARATGAAWLNAIGGSQSPPKPRGQTCKVLLPTVHTRPLEHVQSAASLYACARARPRRRQFGRQHALGRED